MTVLVVEDDRDNRYLLTEFLKYKGYRAIGVANGLDALNHLQHHPHPQLILLDLLMPVMDGAEFRHAQRQDPQLGAIPAVMLSVEDTMEEQARQLGASAFLPKPVDLDVLLTVVEQYCT